MSRYGTDPIWLYVVGIAVVVIGVVLCYGPAGIKTSMSGWFASGYGSDWLVVQYAQSGCIITTWDLKNEAIQNESGSDGIYFVTDEGPVVHLSGHYVYVQYPDEEARDTLLRPGLCIGEEPNGL